MYSARHTDSLRAKYAGSLCTYLQKHLGQKFTASDLKGGTDIPKTFVRRALTVDDERVAEVPMPDVGMEWKKDRWYFWWKGQ